MKLPAIPKTEEFEQRQGVFDFGIAARAALKIIIEAKAKLVTWWKGERPRPTDTQPTWKQLSLALTSSLQLATLAAALRSA